MTPPSLTPRSTRREDFARSYLLDLINASWTTQVVAASVELRIPDLLADAPRDVVALAQASGCHAPSLRRLMSALASLALVQERRGGEFELTQTGALLRTDTNDSLAWWGMLCGRASWARWAGLADSVRTGQSARRRAGDGDDFAAYERDRGASDVFYRAMSNLTKPIADAVAEAFDSWRVERVVDVGGGLGDLLATILTAQPQLRGVLFDLEHVVASASEELARAGVTDRCEVVGGSFFDAIPRGGDAYLLKSVLHNWDDERCSVILRQCGRAMTADPARTPRLLVIERIRSVRPSATPRDQAIARSDLNMLVSLGGRERTEGEFQGLLIGAGLRIERVSELPNAFSLIEAKVAPLRV